MELSNVVSVVNIVFVSYLLSVGGGAHLKVWLCETGFQLQHAALPRNTVFRSLVAVMTRRGVDNRDLRRTPGLSQ